MVLGLKHCSPRFIFTDNDRLLGSVSCALFWDHPVNLPYLDIQIIKKTTGVSLVDYFGIILRTSHITGIRVTGLEARSNKPDRAVAGREVDCGIFLPISDTFFT